MKNSSHHYKASSHLAFIDAHHIPDPEWGVPEVVFLENRLDAQSSSSVSFSLFAVPLFPSDLAEGNFTNGHCRGARDERCKFLTVSVSDPPDYAKASYHHYKATVHLILSDAL